MHVSALVRLKLYQIEFLKVEQTHPANVIESQITPACLRLNQTWTGLNNLYMIKNLHSVFDMEPEQHKFVEKSLEENKKARVCVKSVPNERGISPLTVAVSDNKWNIAQLNIKFTLRVYDVVYGVTVIVHHQNIWVNMNFSVCFSRYDGKYIIQ